MLELISGFVTFLTAVGIFQAYGFGLLGLIVVGLYLFGWEIIGSIFDEARKGTPTPLRFLITIIEDIFGISFG